MRPSASLSLGCFTAASLLVPHHAHAGTITDGDASLVIAGTPAFSLAQGDGGLFTDTDAIDQLYKYCWYFRTPGTQNSLFSKVETPDEQFFGDSATFNWTNLGNGADRFNAELIVHIVDGPQPGQTLITHTMRITSAASTTRTFEIFNLIDLDLSGSAIDDTISAGELLAPSGQRALMHESSSAAAELFGLDSTHYLFGAGSSVRSAVSTGSSNLADTAGPFTGDCAGAFQWSLTLAPGESAIIYGGFALNQTVPCPADFDNNAFVNGDDYDMFYQLFVAGDPHSDFDHNGFPNGDDVDKFAERFLLGC